jgi:hypothetical protein
LEVVAWVELLERWPALGETCPLAPLFDFQVNEPTAAEYLRLSGELRMDEAEVAMVVSRMHRRFQEVLREKVRDTVTSSEEMEVEWAELFPENAATTRDDNG